MSVSLRIEPHRESWGRDFEIEATRIQRALGSALNTLHHIGSTAIPGIHAKPIIDILADVVGLDTLDQHSSDMQALGYECLGEFGIPGRRYFRKDNARGMRTHQIHAFEQGTVHLHRHLAFRDYLRDRPDVARAYCELKRNLVASCAGDIEAYMDGKNPFIKDVERNALLWFSARGQQDAATDP
jgi:GrpB-like predicted nucleotidyltransferase (UPF0157 family)